MQIAINLNTHRAIQDLKSLGVDEKTVEGIANIVASIVGEYQGDLATKADLQEVKADLKEVKSELKDDIRKLESKIDKEINNLRLEIRDMHASLIKWVIGAQFVTVGMILTVFKLFI